MEIAKRRNQMIQMVEEYIKKQGKKIKYTDEFMPYFNAKTRYQFIISEREKYSLCPQGFPGEKEQFSLARMYDGKITGEATVSTEYPIEDVFDENIR